MAESWSSHRQPPRSWTKKRFDKWLMFAVVRRSGEALRIKSQGYQESVFCDPVTLMIDEERRTFFSAGNHYESKYYLTLVYLPPADQQKKIEDFFIEKGQAVAGDTYETHLKTFINECDRLYSLLSDILPEAQPLDDDETLTYLHSCVSPEHHFVKTPEIPMYLDGVIADTPLISGLEPRLGDYHLRVVSILGFPGSTMPGILDNLNKLNFEYRWVTRFLPLDKKEAIAELGRYRRMWFSKRKGIATLIKETITGTESAIVDNDATNKAMDADSALQEVADDVVSYGYFTASAIVMDKDYNIAEKKVRALEKTINGLGFTVINETLNAVDAWFGSIPGLCRANVRRPLLSTLNLSHIFPLSAVWAGPEKNKHLNAPVLIQTQTSGHTPFRLDLYVGDVGHTMIVGPTGSGKSVLLSFIAAQFRRYKDAQVYYFDKDASVKALTAGVGGDFYDLAGDGSALAFQPLAAIDNDSERAWAAGWIHEFLVSENVVVTPEVKKSVWTALLSLAASPREERTITGFSLLLQDAKLRQALEPATINGPFGHRPDHHRPLDRRSPSSASTRSPSSSARRSRSSSAASSSPGRRSPTRSATTRRPGAPTRSSSPRSRRSAASSSSACGWRRAGSSALLADARLLRLLRGDRPARPRRRPLRRLPGARRDPRPDRARRGTTSRSRSWRRSPTSILNLILVPAWGIVGAGVALIVSYLIVIVLIYVRQPPDLPDPVAVGPARRRRRRRPSSWSPPATCCCRPRAPSASSPASPSSPSTRSSSGSAARSTATSAPRSTRPDQRGQPPRPPRRHARASGRPRATSRRGPRSCTSRRSGTGTAAGSRDPRHGQGRRSRPDLLQLGLDERGPDRATGPDLPAPDARGRCSLGRRERGVRW